MRVLLILLVVGVLLSCKDNSTVSVEMTTTTTNDNTTSNPTGSGSDNSSTGTTSTTGSDNSSTTTASSDNSSNSSSSSLQDLINPTVSETFGDNQNFRFLDNFSVVQNNFGNVQSSYGYQDIMETQNNFFITSGTTKIIRYDLNFNYQSEYESADPTNKETIYDIFELQNGNLLLAGSDYANGDTDAYFRIVDNSFNLISEFYDGNILSSDGQATVFTSIAEFNNEVLLGGGGPGFNTGVRNFIYNYDISGTNKLESLTESLTNSFYISDLTVDIANNELLAITSATQNTNQHQINLFKYDSNLNRIWKNTLGTYTYSKASYAIDAEYLSNSNFVLVGSYNVDDTLFGLKNSGENDAIIILLDSMGNKLKIVTFNSINNDYASSVISDSKNVFISVCTNNSVIGISNQGRYDCHVLKFDLNLNLIARKTYASSGDEHISKLIISKDGNKLIVLGSSNGNLFGNLNSNRPSFIDQISL